MASYRRATRRFSRVHRAAAAVFTGYWLGRLGPEALARVDEEYYDSAQEATAAGRAPYDSMEYLDTGLSAWEASAVQEYFPLHRPVVVTAAGTGRELLALLRLGYDAVGYESHPRLLEAGRRLLREVDENYAERLRPCARSTFPPDSSGPASVLVGWGSYMCIAGASARVAFLTAAREVLTDDAALLVSFYLAPDAETRAMRTTAVVGNAVRRLRRVEERVEVGDQLVPFFMHLFDRAGIERELRAAGLRVMHVASVPYGHAVALRA